MSYGFSKSEKGRFSFRITFGQIQFANVNFHSVIEKEVPIMNPTIARQMNQLSRSTYLSYQTKAPDWVDGWNVRSGSVAILAQDRTCTVLGQISIANSAQLVIGIWLKIFDLGTRCAFLDWCSTAPYCGFSLGLTPPLVRLDYPAPHICSCRRALPILVTCLLVRPHSWIQDYDHFQ